MPEVSNVITPDDREFDNIKKVALSLETASDDKVVVELAPNVRISLPRALYRVLVDAAQLLAKGNAVEVLSINQDLSTQQAAEILQVSRPHVIKLLEDGEIPHYKVGSHRRIKLDDVLDYKNVRDAHRKRKLAELYQISDDAGLYEIDTFPENDDDETEE